MLQMIRWIKSIIREYSSFGKFIHTFTFLKSNISSKTLESFKSFDASKGGERKLNIHVTTKTSILHLVDMGKNKNSLEK